MSEEVVLSIPQKLQPVFTGTARYRGAYGGRGSGKTRTFAQMCVVRALDLAYNQKKAGTIMCARESMKSLRDSSMSEIKSVVRESGLDAFFRYGEHFIKTANGLIEFSFDGLRQNVDNLKSKSRVHICWIDEAENISESSWQTLLPTIREEGSEIWVTWNPKFDGSATDLRFKRVVEGLDQSIATQRSELSKHDKGTAAYTEAQKELDRLEASRSDYRIVSINWSDNPWFPETLNKERQRDQELDPLLYRHVWEGDYITVSRGSYYARYINEARDEGRITTVNYDPLHRLYAFWDIGGAGARADATAIWMVQFVDKQIRFVDYIEAKGQTLGYYVQWLRSKRYDTALMVLPHDGRQSDRIYGISVESELQSAGFSVEVVPNQGSGAAMQRIEASRKRFNAMFFDEARTTVGLKALEWYQEKWDENRNVGLGPNHDWSSHAADAFGMVSIYYKDPTTIAHYRRPPRLNSSWAGI